MAKVIIFGCKKNAEIAHYYLSTDSEHDVVAFCVNKEYLPKDKFLKSLPIVEFEKIDKLFSNKEYSLFSPFNSGKMNKIKEDIYNSILKKGYKMISYVSSKASINNAVIGDNCFIQEWNVLAPFSKVGNNVMMWGSNVLGHHSEIKDHVTITSHVVIAGDCIIGANSFLGLNCTLRNNIVLAKGTLVGLGTVIVRNTQEWSVYMGNPGKKIGGSISQSILNI